MLSRKILALTVVTILILTAEIFGSETTPHKPTDKDKCPVCGMFVAKYPDWVGEILFKDGARFFFDGAKDLFKFYFNLKKYAPDQTQDDITGIYVTDYYDMELIEAPKAIFVIGSDVYGPMGRELIPLKNNADARQFMNDHRGQQQMGFGEITKSLAEGLDK